MRRLTKWGSVGLASFGALSIAHVLITDDGLSEQAREVLTGKVGQLKVVHADRSANTPTSPA